MPIDKQDKQQICKRLATFSEELGWTPTKRVGYFRKKYGKICCIDLSIEELKDFEEMLTKEEESGNNLMDQLHNIPIQKILFGCPGTGKSHKICNDEDGGIIKKVLKIDPESENVIKTVFHPEYTYGDFMGKLMPLTNPKEQKVEYTFYAGHFLKALSQAYKNILTNKEGENIKNVVLIIDEINRGNSSAIFGTIFQLLDRSQDGWSSYGISISDLEFSKLIELTGFKFGGINDDKNILYKYGKQDGKLLEKYQDILEKINIKVEGSSAIGSCIRLPPNLSILATMNTSDNSIYFMDNAFKRRWDWEYIDWDNNSIPIAEYGNHGTLERNSEWMQLIRNFNHFIKQHHNSVRGGRIEDMQIGYYFINANPVTEEHIRNKLMFFVWDSVFSRDKSPLCNLLNIEKDKLVTFGDFIRFHNQFVDSLLNYQN